jgi:hypothetical protein
MLIAQQIIVWILAPLSLQLPGKVTVDVPAAIKQHNQQGGHDHCNPYTTLLDRLKLSKYALYVKEPDRVFQAHACFAVIIYKFLKFSQIICNFIVLHVVICW